LPRNDAELTWRFGMILACFNMMLLGIGLAATNPRRANNWNLLFALMGFVVYFNLLNLSQSWVANSRLSMGGALTAVHGAAFLLALGLLWLRDQGNRLGRARRHKVAAA
jgi:lipopolysaccharide export system permease protein